MLAECVFLLRAQVFAVHLWKGMTKLDETCFWMLLAKPCDTCMVEYGGIWWKFVEYGGIKIAWVMAGYCVLGRATASHIEQWQVNMCDPVPRNLAGENLWDLGPTLTPTIHDYHSVESRSVSCNTSHVGYMLDTCFKFLQLCANKILFCSSLIFIALPRPGIRHRWPLLHVKLVLSLQSLG